MYSDPLYGREFEKHRNNCDHLFVETEEHEAMRKICDMYLTLIREMLGEEGAAMLSGFIQVSADIRREELADCIKIGFEMSRKSLL